MNWLVGEWINVSGEKTLYEVWQKSNDSLFTGTSFLLVGNDTVFHEKIAIKQTANDLLYIPTVSDQNEGKPVEFRLISDNGGIFVFENKEHDFPQRIVYSNPETDSLYAYIDGNENGKYHKSEFRFKRKY